MAELPQTKYARSGDGSIAYQVFGDGPRDLIVIPGFVSHLEFAWENPNYARFMDRLGSMARVLVFDKRGTGLSDPITGETTFEQRSDDTRAVMDAVGIERATLMGISEGASMASLFAATYPERAEGLVLYGLIVKGCASEDWPWGLDREAWEIGLDGIREAWGEGISLISLAPGKLEDEAFRKWFGRFERLSASPGAVLASLRLNMELDIRPVLSTLRLPTLILHRDGDIWPIEGARYMAERVEGAKLVELPGENHWPFLDEIIDDVLDEIEEFLTGSRQEREPDRVLATVMFTDIVGSTERAATVGDRRWRDLLEGHERLVRRELERFRGQEVNTTGDGFLATFDGPARGIRCARAITTGVRELGIEVRAGLHTGECELRNGDVGGIAVHTGARVSGLAEPGEVLVSSTVKDLVAGSEIQFEDRGAHELKGVPGQWRLFAVRSV